MATRIKTVQYCFPLYTSAIADATLTSLGTKTIYIPELTRTFKSVTAEISYTDMSTATGATITEHRVSMVLGAAGASTFTELDDIANSGENMGGVIGPVDFTSYFVSSFGAGASQTLTASVYLDVSTGTGLTTINGTCIMTITYEYDDAASTHIKTVWIPLESGTGALGTSAAQIGTNQIPALDTFLPEASKTIRDYFFVIEANENGNSGTTDLTINMRIDTDGAAQTCGAIERGLGTDKFTRLVWDLSATKPATNIAHAFYMWANVAYFHTAVITLVVTYEFNPATTTSVLNSVYIPLEVGSPLGLNAAGASRFQRDFRINEPTTITLAQSAYRINYNTPAAVAGLNTRAGSQSYRNYVDNGGVVAGMFCHQQRIDSGSAQGAGITLARGKNTITVDMYRTDTTDDPNNINGYILLNYTSGKSPSGVGAHNHTVFYLMAAWDAALTDRYIKTAWNPNIPESNYWIVGNGFYVVCWDANVVNAITFDVQVLSTESKGAGFVDIYADARAADAERGCSIIWMRGRDAFKRFPEDADDDRLAIETARDYRFYTAGTTAKGIMYVLTYHSMTWTISGTVSGYEGDGSGITVKLFRDSDKSLMQSTTTATGGTYSFTVYDDTEDYYTDAYVDATHVGRSAPGKAA